MGIVGIFLSAEAVGVAAKSGGEMLRACGRVYRKRNMIFEKEIIMCHSRVVEANASGVASYLEDVENLARTCKRGNARSLTTIYNSHQARSPARERRNRASCDGEKAGAFVAFFQAVNG